MSNRDLSDFLQQVAAFREKHGHEWTDALVADFASSQQEPSLPTPKMRGVTIVVALGDGTVLSHVSMGCASADDVKQAAALAGSEAASNWRG